MGGLKFRLGRVRKYTDQQKRKPVTLMVSIPRSLVSVQASTGLYLSPCPIRDTLSDCSDTPPSESSPLTVSFPLAKQWRRSNKKSDTADRGGEGGGGGAVRFGPDTKSVRGGGGGGAVCFRSDTKVGGGGCLPYDDLRLCARA